MHIRLRVSNIWQKDEVKQLSTNKTDNFMYMRMFVNIFRFALSVFLFFLLFFKYRPLSISWSTHAKMLRTSIEKKISSQVWFQLQRNSIIGWNSKNLKTCELEGDRKKHKYFEFIFSNGILQLFFSPFSFYRVTYILEKFSIRYWTECRA